MCVTLGPRITCYSCITIVICMIEAGCHVEELAGEKEREHTDNTLSWKTESWCGIYNTQHSHFFKENLVTWDWTPREAAKYSLLRKGNRFWCTARLYHRRFCCIFVLLYLKNIFNTLISFFKNYIFLNVLQAFVKWTYLSLVGGRSKWKPDLLTSMPKL